MRLLLLSSSRTAEDETFLGHALPVLQEQLTGCQRIAMIPFAGVILDWDEYREFVAAVLPDKDVISVHREPDALVDCDAVIVGGGNTFQLLREIHARGQIAILRERLRSGIPYIGWSAGSNLACPGLYTTNDMPIVEPPSFEGLDLIPFQINPHFSDAHPPGHRGETRRMRIEEFLTANPEETVVGLPEGAWLRRDGATLTLGGKTAMLFRPGVDASALRVGDISVLL